ncbi:MAG: hypothetical protein LC798_09065 [Chloroflexi bacterium]|nr:hypothetical protein [Chloroflexota bacterium]
MIDRARRLRPLAPAMVVLALALAWQLPDAGWLRLSASDGTTADRMTTALDRLPDEPRVLVGFDPDIGTYAEIRPTVRALLADLLARDGRLAVVSLTAEGRALASAELARLARGRANADRLLDLGFITGAEAGLVDITRDIRLPDGVPDSLFAGMVARDGLGAFDGIATIGGIDLGPRSWVEQVAPRTGDLPMVAVVPTVLLPQVQPYVAGGQLAAVLGTPRDGAAYRESVELGDLDRLREPFEPRSLPVLVGVLIAIAVLGQALGTRVMDALRAIRAREAA